MATSNTLCIDLNKDNYDTWKIQIEALLVKSDTWEYVSGENLEPRIIEEDAASLLAAKQWKSQDAKAKSDLILSINPTEWFL